MLASLHPTPTHPRGAKSAESKKMINLDSLSVSLPLIKSQFPTHDPTSRRLGFLVGRHGAGPQAQSPKVQRPTTNTKYSSTSADIVELNSFNLRPLKKNHRI